VKAGRRVLVAGFVIIAMLLVIVGVGAAFCSATMHVERTTMTGQAGLAMRRKLGNVRDVTITAGDGARLQGWFIGSGRAPNRCVVIPHGIGDSRLGSAGFAPMFLQAGYSVLLPDARAHGSSGGELVTYGLLEKHDVLGWVAWLTSAGCTSIYGLGQSLGGATLI
jgi:predicted alpha/beta-fold hydrolase